MTVAARRNDPFNLLYVVNALGVAEYLAFLNSAWHEQVFRA